MIMMMKSIVEKQRLLRALCCKKRHYLYILPLLKSQHRINQRFFTNKSANKDEFTEGRHFIQDINDHVDIVRDKEGELRVKLDDGTVNTNDTLAEYIYRRKQQRISRIGVFAASAFVLAGMWYNAYRKEKEQEEVEKLRVMASEQFTNDMNEYMSHIQNDSSYLNEEALLSLLDVSLDNRQINRKLNTHDTWLVEHLLSINPTDYSNRARLIISKWLTSYANAYRLTGPVDLKTQRIRKAFQIDVAKFQVKLLDYDEPNENLRRPLRVLQWDAAFESFNLNEMNRIFNELYAQKDRRFEETARLLSAAPILGRWSILPEITNEYKQLHKYSAYEISNAWRRNAIANPNVPDYNQLADWAPMLEDRDMKDLDFCVYDIKRLLLSYKEMECPKENEKCDEIQQYHEPGLYDRRAKDGRVWLQQTMALTPPRLLQWGAIGQMVNITTPTPLVLWGPMNHHRLHLFGYMPVRDTDGTILHQTEEWRLVRKDDTNIWFGEYKSTQDRAEKTKVTNDKMDKVVSVTYNVICEFEPRDIL